MKARIKIIHPGDGKTVHSPWMEQAAAVQDLKVIQAARREGDLVELDWYSGESHDIVSASLQDEPEMPRAALGRGLGGRPPA